MTPAIRLALAAAAAVAVTLSAQQAAAPPPFRFERPIVTNGAGPRRLAIDVPLLSGAAPFHTVTRLQDGVHPVLVAEGDGLRDLRLYDAAGAEVGYMVISAPPAVPTYTRAVLLPVTPVNTDAVKTSGLEADLGRVMTVDRFRVDVQPPYLKRVRLEGSGDREHWTSIAAESTLFDLPEERLRQNELRFRAGEYRYLRLTWDDSSSARVAAVSASAGQIGASHPPPPLTTPIAFERRPSEPGRSRFRLRLPGGRLPIAALDLDAAGGHILRRATVYQAQLTSGQLSPTPLGTAILQRVVRGDLAASALRVTIRPPTDAQLDLQIDDGDNPPFELQSVTAVFAELPWIYLEAPGGALTARYGNATLTVPRYDIEAARDQVRIESIADASWGEPRERTPEENAVVPAPPLPTVGSTLDTSLFHYVRQVPAGAAGLVTVPLDLSAVAHSAGPGRQFADLRVVDAAGRQIPYVIEQMVEPLSLDLALEKAAPPKSLPPAQSARSVYRVTYPVAGLPQTRVVLATAARVFRRTVIVGQEREPDNRHRDRRFETLGAVAWVHADQDRPAPPLTLTLPPIQGTSLFIAVDEGDNAPLEINTVRLLLPSYRLRLFRDSNVALRVAYGRTDLPRPQYDLALLAPQVLGTPAADVTLEPERGVEPASTTAAMLSPRLFWAALAAAVIVLLGLIARLLQKESTG
jgi:hypothetical protein